LHRYKTFAELFVFFPSQALGAKNKADLNGIFKYYSREQEVKYGIFEIEVTKKHSREP